MGRRYAASKKNDVPEEVVFQTKPQIALEQIRIALKNGVCVSAWTFDELYGRGSKFLDGIVKQGQAFVGEIPVTFHGWMREPKTVTIPLKNKSRGCLKQSPRLEVGDHSSEVSNLAKHSSAFRQQAWEPYHIKNSNKGPVVWEIKWAKFWRKDAHGWATEPHCLIVARNVLTGEEKYFLSNCLPGDKNPATGESVTLCWLLRINSDGKRVISGSEDKALKVDCMPAVRLVCKTTGLNNQAQWTKIWTVISFLSISPAHCLPCSS